MFPRIKKSSNKKDLYEIDSFANRTPEYSSKRFEALKNGIVSVGQLHPILLRNNKIVDGRHRYKACLKLGIEPKVVELGDISDEEVLKYIKALTVSKDKSDTQLAIEAYYLYTDEKANGVKTTLKKIADELGVSIKSIQRAKYVADVKPEYIKPLFKGKSIFIRDISNKQDLSISALRTIESVLKRNASLGNVEVVEPTKEEDKYDIDWKILFETEEGFSWFMSLLEGDYISHYKLAWWHLVEYANLKYPSLAEVDLKLLTTDDLENIIEFTSMIPHELYSVNIIEKIKETIVKKKAI